MRTLVPWLWLAGAVQVAIVAANFVLPKKLRCREALTRVSPIIREVFVVHWVYIAFIVAAYLPVGCAWLVASRAGLSPMGFQEPIVLLTAVHFHFAGFAAPILAAATTAALEKTKIRGCTIFKAVAIGVVCGPGLLAAGFLTGPHLKLVAALLIVGSEIGLALFFLRATRQLQPRPAQVLVVLSAASVLFAMVLVAVWAIGDFRLKPLVDLAAMARFHGTANAIGFTTCGLVGWTLAARSGVLGRGGAS